MTIGASSTPRIGDTVNVASRLETASKTFAAGASPWAVYAVERAGAIENLLSPGLIVRRP